jgi:hypothetical protein
MKIKHKKTTTFGVVVIFFVVSKSGDFEKFLLFKKLLLEYIKQKE